MGCLEDMNRSRAVMSYGNNWLGPHSMARGEAGREISYHSSVLLRCVDIDIIASICTQNYKVAAY